MRAWAIDSGLAVGVLRVTAVDASASSACSPSGVRLARSLDSMRSSSSFLWTYRCEQRAQSMAAGADLWLSYLVQFSKRFPLYSFENGSLLVSPFVCH